MADRSREDGPDWRNTPRYARLRASLLAREPCCRLCTERGILGVTAEEMDHINPVVFGGDRWDEDNLQPLCEDCHAAKSAKEQQVHRRPSSYTCIHGTISTEVCPDCQDDLTFGVHNP